jgi:hypothetical protein
MLGALALALMLAPAGATAADDGSVYVWRDRDGSVRFSHPVPAPRRQRPAEGAKTESAPAQPRRPL